MYTLWYPPKHEICYSNRLIEVGEIFNLPQTNPNDDIMRMIGQIIPIFKNKNFWRCDSCSKKFSLERFLKLHRINGCGRTKDQQIFYKEYEDDPSHEFELALLKGWT